MGICCFMLEPTTMVRCKLRRYTPSDADRPVCPYASYHDASFHIGDVPIPLSEGGVFDIIESAPPQDDPRWPKTCACGYTFQDDDEWQLFTEHLYRRVDSGELVTIREAPVGAMFWSPWLIDAGCVGPDGKLLSIITPAGQWNIDQESTSGGHWRREGAPPNVTADPSIHFVGRWHGWLRNGELIGA